MITVTLRYGTTRLADMAVDEGSTINDLKRTFGTALRLPESVQALVNNVPEDGDYRVEDGDSVVFEKQACKKAR